MKSSLSSLAVLTLLTLVGGEASAQANFSALINGYTAASEPAWDATSTDIFIANNRVSGADTETYSWSPALSGRILGGHSGDVLVVTVKQGRQDHGSARCSVSSRCDQQSMLTQGRGSMCSGQRGDFGGLTPFVSIDCRMDDIQIQQAGDFEMELAYEDANSGETTIVGTLQLSLGQVARMTNRQERRHSAQYVLLPRDMVGSSWIEYSSGAFGYTSYQSEDGSWREFDHFVTTPQIHFYALNGNPSRPGDAALRCRVDGEVIRLNQSYVRVGRTDGQQQEDWRTPDGEEVTREKFGWNHYTVSVPWRMLIRFNEREARNQSSQGFVPGGDDRTFDMTANPGAYECNLVVEGEAIRTFRFNVSEATVERHPEQLAEQSLPMVFGRFFIETEIPDSSSFDQIFDQRAARATGFMGRPWTDAVSDMTSAFPRSTRVQAPPAVPGARNSRGARRGRRR